ncbi:hypothetical protein BC938DRAFT_472362 [Jimgerdemannia flammicorona]|uniref:Uncharacterized protein n=1 Tax=Jimgerdemannia flammicorona TaxID=994334 RepID=A0A433Q692_9FUNG|nr:hypothetical protein BC938DRAFT_472362 [Jimgerdemannia flammicorona]
MPALEVAEDGGGVVVEEGCGVIIFGLGDLYRLTEQLGDGDGLPEMTVHHGNACGVGGELHLLQNGKQGLAYNAFLLGEVALVVRRLRSPSDVPVRPRTTSVLAFDLSAGADASEDDLAPPGRVRGPVHLCLRLGQGGLLSIAGDVDQRPRLRRWMHAGAPDGCTVLCGDDGGGYMTTEFLDDLLHLCVDGVVDKVGEVGFVIHDRGRGERGGGRGHAVALPLHVGGVDGRIGTCTQDAERGGR